MSRALDPARHAGVFAFVCVPDEHADGVGLDVVARVREAEGTTLVIPEEQALARGLAVRFRCAWITLQLPSALDATGLTARFAAALAADGIACNVVAGAHHDHLFVPVERADDALRLLRGLRWGGGAERGLAAARERIDAIDDELVRLLAERMQQVAVIGAHKAAQARAAVVDRQRQREVARRWLEAARRHGVSPFFARRVLREVLTYSRRGQERLRRPPRPPHAGS